MQIGSTIRKRRKELGMTQAQLANAVHVSVQAISKWETGAGLPDISQLIPLAKALHLSVDQLLSNRETDAALEQRWKDTLRLYGDHPEKLLEISTAILKEYPDHPTFLYRAAVDEERISRTAPERAKQRLLEQAQYHAERLLALQPNHEDGKELLVSIYTALQLQEKAIALALRCENQDRALTACLTADALRAHRQKLIDRKAQSLLSEMMVPEKDLLNQAEQLLTILYPGQRHPFANRIALLRARIALDRGEQETGRRILDSLLASAPSQERPGLLAAFKREFPEMNFLCDKTPAAD